MNSPIFAGYVVASGLPHITESQAKRLTHLNVAFGIVKDKKINVEEIEKYFRFLPKLRAYNPNLNILLSTGGGNQIGHGEATADEESLAAFVKSTMEVVEKYNFRLNNNAKHLKQQVSSGIVIIVKGSQNMLFAAIVERLQRLIEERDYAFLIYYIGEQENEVEHAWQICRERHPSGILFLGSDLKFFRESFSQISVPCVLVTNSGRELGFENLSSVSTDDEAAAEAAVEHLISLGHTKIGILGGWRDKSRAAHTRYTGCVRAFEKHGIPFSREKQYVPALFAMSEGYEAMGRLLDRMPDLTAVFAMADVLAVGAIRAVRDRGLRVPEDVSVVGFDGIELGSYLTPSLATIRQDRERIADRSVELLLSQIENRVSPEHELVPFQIISGESARKL